MLQLYSCTAVCVLLVPGTVPTLVAGNGVAAARDLELMGDACEGFAVWMFISTGGTAVGVLDLASSPTPLVARSVRIVQ